MDTILQTASSIASNVYLSKSDKLSYITQFIKQRYDVRFNLENFLLTGSEIEFYSKQSKCWIYKSDSIEKIIEEVRTALKNETPHLRVRKKDVQDVFETIKRNHYIQSTKD